MLYMDVDAEKPYFTSCLAGRLPAVTCTPVSLNAFEALL